jgi:ribonuclease Z
MKLSLVAALTSGVLLCAAAPAHAAPCLEVIVTGAQGGPQAYEGQAGPGTLIRYGDDANNCNAVRLQFDVGRGTTLRLSQLGIQSGQLNAVFITHMHSDHSEGLIDLLQHRWHFASAGPKLDVVCSSDAASPLGFTVSCRKFVAHIGDALMQGGEIAQRRSEDTKRAEGGPAAVANVVTFDPKNEPQVVWSSGDVKVNAIRSTHIAGHASYRVDTPAGSVVIGGDAGNDAFAPPRPSSTSDQVERLAKGADVIVHSAIHPVMGPDRDSGMPAPIFFRQSTAGDLGALAQRAGAKHLVLTHLVPAPGADRQGAWKVPGGALTDADYRKAAEGNGFTGNVVVGKDLARLRLPAK